MRRGAWVLLAVLLLGAAESEPLGVWIDRPLPGASAFGPTEIVVAVESEGPVTVELFVDGKLVGELIRRPFEVLVDLGYENLSHEITAVARDPSGRRGTATVTTEPVHIDEAIKLPLQQLYVTVSNSSGRVLGLSQDRFRVIDSGQDQEIVTFESGEIPLTAVLLLDCSLSMAGARLEAALAGAQLFLENMAELDEAKVMLFSDRLLRETGFSADPVSLRPALHDVEALGGTALNDYLFMALEKLDMRQGRRVVVAFTDGSDVHSVLPMSNVLKKAQISQALIYWILLQEQDDQEGAPRYTTAWRNVAANREEFDLLRKAIRESGGRVRAVNNLDELDDAFIEILSELREQYVLGYYPTNNRDDGSWHEVKVRVDRPGLEVRTREGYLDY